MRKYVRFSVAASVLFLGGASVVSEAWSATAPSKAPFPVLVRAFQNKYSARLTFTTDGVPNFAVRRVDGGVEIVSEGNGEFQVAKLPKLREIGSLKFRSEGTARIGFISLSMNCEIQEHRIGHSIRVDLIERPRTWTQTELAASAPPPLLPPLVPPPAQSTPNLPLEALRTDLEGKLAQIKAPAPADTGGAVATSQVATLVADTASPASAPQPACAAAFDMSGWKGTDIYAERLRILRILAARTGESTSAMAALAEFYIGNGLGGEALAVTEEVKSDSLTSADRQRLQRDADLGRLLKGMPIAETSVLLKTASGCDRQDAPLWRVLSAAASGDQEVIQRDSMAAARVLESIAAPLANLFAFRIADASVDDINVLQAMAKAVRNSDISSPEDGAARFLLQARIAHAQKNAADEVNFLQRAAQDVGLTGLKARVQLAELRVDEENDEGRQSQVLLADTARVYRDTAVGHSAAAALSEEKLLRGDYAGALRVANDSAPLPSSGQPDSHGAALAVRVLRKLLVDQDVPNLPPAEQRMLIYWRYGGYTTPGEKGDDIRLGAAELMMDQDMPEAALDVVHQMSPQTIQSPQGALVFARAEARAGDPANAIALLKDIPANDGTPHIAAEALQRLGKGEEAAHQLDASTDLSDKVMRASLFYEAKNWSEAVDGYAAVLRDPALTKEARAQAADHYALAVALSGQPPADDLRGFTGLAEHVLGALPGVIDTQQKPVSALRGSLHRAAQIESLLPPTVQATAANGGS